MSVSMLAGTIKVACVGDSVTYGYGISDKEHDSYPAQLQQMLGDGYEVRNFGHNGATLLRHGHRPYNTLEEYGQALEYKADIVIIHLGLNDTDPRNWPHYAEEFIPDYHTLIEDFRRDNPDVRIWICKMTPIMHGHWRFQSGTRDWHAAEQEAIVKVAEGAGTGLIDLYEPLFVRPDLFPDNLHPTPEGAGIIAKTVYGAITGDYGGLKLSPMYTDNMVIQQGKAVVFEGTADAGEKVTVRFAGESRQNVTADNGRWEVEFPTMAAGGPYDLKIKCKSGSAAFKNIWIGEVWICAGQSNMEFPLRNCLTAKEDIAAASSHRKLHLFQMKENYLTGNVTWSKGALDTINHLGLMNPEGWKMADAGNAGDFSAVGYNFAAMLSDSLDCHIGIINCSVGGSTTESWCDRSVLAWDFPQVLYNWNKGDFGQEWARGRALKNMGDDADPLQRHPYHPGYMFDAGVRMIGNVNPRGVLWYQGESNAHNIELHETLFKLMVKSFREFWGKDTRMQVIQLSGIGTRPSWPRFRDSQRRLAEQIENTGLTVCSDLGHPTDVHPREKRTVGHRAAQSVLHDVYGFKGLVPSGPVCMEARAEGRTAVLSFNYAEGLSVSEGFEIAGRDGIYYPAAIKVDGNKVMLQADQVPAPESVRYAWQANPDKADLKNGAGLPASTFTIGIE